MRRYDGNSGKYVHIPEGRDRTRGEYQPQKDRPFSVEKPVESKGQKKAMPPPNQFGSGLQNLLSNIFAQGFEVEDLLLFAVLFLMYQETKDKELLIIMGGMFLL